MESDALLCLVSWNYDFSNPCKATTHSVQILKKARTSYKAYKAAHVLMGNDSPRGTPIIVKENHPADKASRYKNDWSFPAEKLQIV